MQRYKKSYKSHFEIMDGDFWGFNVRYHDSELNIESHGNNAWPKDGNKAFSEIIECIEKHTSTSDK